MPEKHWKSFGTSRFPWEQEALDFVFERFPAQDNYLAWSLLEFIAQDGSLNEIDLLVVCPQGAFLIEIKSRPGAVTGNQLTWCWENEGRRFTDDNPVILANRKCKRLKSLLAKQRAFKKLPVPYIEPIVFLSHSQVRCHLEGSIGHYVRLRDTDAKEGKPGRDGIMAAIRSRACPGLRQFSSPPLNRPAIRAFAQAMEQAGFRPTQKSRKVGDFTLQQLLFESPTRAYQDWLAQHVSYEKTTRRARIYLVNQQATPVERDIIRKAAEREFKVLERLEHPGIVRADLPTECDLGPVLFLRTDAESQRLDHFLQSKADSLSVDHRLDILRQLTDIIRYAHGKGVVHRSLSPQSILVRAESEDRFVVQVFNWQTGIRFAGSTIGQSPNVSATLHAGQLLEDASLVYVAPEAFSGGADGGPEMDIFSLGTLSYLLFTGVAPASSQMELHEKLRHSGGGLRITDTLDGAVDALKDLVQFSANGDVALRDDITTFRDRLEEIEDELTRPARESADPLNATNGDRLEGGLKVLKDLGGGTSSKVLLVEQGGEERVLKLAPKPEYNQRIRDEFDVLNRVRWPNIVTAFDCLEFGELVGFTMERAGERTLAHQLREEGPLDLTLLQQFGEDLLRSIEYLDREGIPHRDIKPENLGVRIPRSKKRRELCIFDFSLSATSPDNINVGTIPYLDPFLSTRAVKRWDVSSECFSAAMTLHEMATGALPVWRDGQSAVHLISDEVTIRAEVFPAEMRDRFVGFFQQALRRDYTQRYDNPGDMLAAWQEIFTSIDTVYPEKESETAYVLNDRMALDEETQLILLNPSTRLGNALDRLNVHTVGELLRYPLQKIYKLRGVGNKTRRELGGLFKTLRERLPQIRAVPSEPGKGEPTPEPHDLAGLETVESIAKQVATLGRGPGQKAEQEILQRFLGWQLPEGPSLLRWPSQSDLAPDLGLTRQRVGQVVTSARQRWSKFPVVTALREEIYQALQAQGGIATHQEIIRAILSAHGSELDDPERTQMTSVAVRAALETEKNLKEPRFEEHRSGDRIFLSLHPDLKAYAGQLGKVADRLAGLDPLPSPSRALEGLRSVRQPSLPTEIALPGDARLPHLAVAASEHAALSSRLEIYPQGLEPRRTLALAQNALFGCTLTLDEIRDRVRSRYPEAAPLPDRPELDQLIQELGLDLRWDPAGADGQGAYEPVYRESLSIQSSEPAPERRRTRLAPAMPAAVEPKIAEARALEEKLQYSAREGAFLVLSVDGQYLRTAQQELERRFAIRPCNLDALFLQLLKQRAAARKAKWDVVLRADAADPQSTDWRNLQRLVDECLPGIEQELRKPDGTRLVFNPGLLARYDRMDLIARLADDVGRKGGIHGLWVLVPANDQAPLPVINHKAIPVTNAAQHARLTEDWVFNRHRAAS